MTEGHQQSSADSDQALVILVDEFSRALLAKLRLAHANGRRGWEKNDWEHDCQQGLLRHVEKGDPRDVAAFCAFMWHHDWITVPAARTGGVAQPAPDLSDWSSLPRDLYVTSVKSDGVVFDVQCCSVPMAIGPEVRYSQAHNGSSAGNGDQITEDMVRAGRAAHHKHGCGAVREIYAAMRAAVVLNEPQTVGWRPIATAPKDGTKVLVWCDEGLDVSQYSDRVGDAPDDMGHDAGWWGMCQPMDPGRSMGAPAYTRDAENQPWAWMPMPAAPYDDEGEPLFSSQVSRPNRESGK